MNNNDEQDYVSASEVHARIMHEGNTCFNLVAYGLSALLGGIIALIIIMFWR